MKKKTLKKWSKRFLESMDTIMYECNGSFENIYVFHSNKKPLIKSFVTRMHNPSFQHYMYKKHSIRIIPGFDYYGIWWYHVPNIKKSNKSIKYRFVTVKYINDSRSPESYLYEEKNKNDMF